MIRIDNSYQRRPAPSGGPHQKIYSLNRSQLIHDGPLTAGRGVREQRSTSNSVPLRTVRFEAKKRQVSAQEKNSLKLLRTQYRFKSEYVPPYEKEVKENLEHIQFLGVPFEQNEQRMRMSGLQMLNGENEYRYRDTGMSYWRIKTDVQAEPVRHHHLLDVIRQRRLVASNSLKQQIPISKSQINFLAKKNQLY